MKIKIFKSLNIELVKDWGRLWEKVDSAHFFNSPEWFIVNSETCSYVEILIIAVYENGKLVGVLPLVKDRVFGVSVYTDVNNFFSEKSSILCLNDSKQIRRALIKKAFQEGDLLIRELSEEEVKHLEVKPGNTLSYVSSISPRIELGGDPLRYLSKKQKNKIINRIKKYNKLEFKTIRNIGQKELNIMREIEGKSYKKESGKNVLDKEVNSKLYDNLIKFAGKYLRLDVVEYEGIPVVFGLGIEYKNTYLAYLTAYDKNFTHLLPGKVLLYFLLNDLHKSGKSIFDFARGLSVLKKEFTENFVTQHDTYFIRSHPKLLYLRIINTLRRMKITTVNQNNNYDNLYLFRTT